MTWHVGADERGQGGTAMEDCPGYWRRHGGYWPCATGWTIGGRSAYAIARETSDGLEHAWPRVVLDNLPGPLFDGVQAYRIERTRVIENRQKAAAAPPPKPGVERF